jgi:hypothetical protein
MSLRKVAPVDNNLRRLRVSVTIPQYGLREGDQIVITKKRYYALGEICMVRIFKTGAPVLCSLASPYFSQPQVFLLPNINPSEPLHFFKGDATQLEIVGSVANCAKVRVLPY